MKSQYLLWQELQKVIYCICIAIVFVCGVDDDWGIFFKITLVSTKCLQENTVLENLLCVYQSSCSIIWIACSKEVNSKDFGSIQCYHIICCCWSSVRLSSR